MYIIDFIDFIARRGDFMIKRIVSAAAAAAIGIACCVSAFAASSSVSVSGDPGKAPLSFMYTENDGEIVKSIKYLIPDLNKVTGKNSITQNLTVQSLSADNKPVTFSLRLSVPQTKTASSGPEQATPSPSPDDDNVLDYYNIVITDKTGDTVYDYKHAEKTSGAAQYKDIALNTLNVSSPSENDVYKITISANSDLSKMATSASRLDWSIVVNGDGEAVVVSGAAATDKPAEKVDDVSVTNAPQITPTTETSEAELVLPTNTPQSVAPSATPTPASGGKTVLAAGSYTVGNELVAGRYEITGDSTVKVYTAEGDLKTNIILTTDKNAKEGVKSYVLNVRDGEMVDVSADTTFEEYIPAKAKATAKPAATSVPHSTARPTSTSAPKTTTAPTKANPQTGDNAPIALAAVIGAAALAIFAVLEIYKRKNR